MLRFHVGPFPVRVFASFFLFSAILGLNFAGEPWRFAAWMFVVFVSVLAHELGHAVVGRAIGGTPEIHLEGMGGVTFPNLRRKPGALRSVALSFAGPLFGLLLGAAAWGLEHLWPPAPGSVSAFVVEMFQFTSVAWAIFNLLPILPLDGGNILLAILEGIRKRPSDGLAAAMSAAIAVAIAGLAFLAGYPLMATWCALFALQNGARAFALRGPAARKPAQRPRASAPDPFELADVQAATDTARAALQQGDLAAALAAAEKLEQQGGPLRQAGGLRLRAGIELSRGDNEAAALYAGQSFSILQTSDAAVVAARANLRSGEEERARNWLRRALEAGAPQAAVRADPELGALG